MFCSSIADLPHLSWIKAPCSPPNVIQCSTGSVCLTRLDQSLLIDSAPLVWTVKPIFIAPKCVERKKRTSLLESLKVSSPFVSDVIRNLINLSKCRFANFSLLNNYPSECICTAGELSMIEVVRMSFEFLEKQNWNCPMNLVSEFQNSSCIPVLADRDISKVVLVKPVEVVKFLKPSEETLKPFINQLPTQLAHYSKTLSKIGVHDTVTLVHIQHILEVLHSIGKTNNPNEINVIYYSLGTLEELIRSYSKEDAAKILTPLYLPVMDGNGWSMKPSNNLVFVDSSRYKKRDPKDFNLTSCQYSLFQIPPLTGISQSFRNQSLSHSQFDSSFRLNDKTLCLSLPSEIRPQALSLCVQETRLDVGRNLNASNNMVLACMNQSKRLVEDFRQILPCMWREHVDRNSTAPTQFIEVFVSIIKTLSIEVIDGLKAQVILDGNCIGTLTSPSFVLEGENQPYTLYIDDATTGEGRFWNELSRSLLIMIAKLLKEVNLKTYFQMIKPIESFLQVNNTSALKCLAETYSVKLETSAMPEQEIENENCFHPKLGKQVPEELVNRSDNVINNIFRPQEWVAYEVSEEYFIWAIVLYSTGTQTDLELLPKYRIVKEKGDENGIEVSIVDLYKIVSSIEEIEAAESDQSLVPIDEDSATAQVKQVKDVQSVMSLKKSVCEDLRRIWKIKNKDEKRKALKRLYVKYHPDKVGPEFKDVYEEVFKFLKRQINRLENNLPLEDPDEASDEERVEVPMPSHWTPHFRQWDTYVPRYRPRSTAYSRQRTDSTHGNTFYPQTWQRTDFTHNNSYTDYPQTSYQTQTDENEAERWLKQAWTDCNVMRVLIRELRISGSEIGSRTSVVCQIIFMAHEVIEKSLKAGMYKLCGLNTEYLTNHEILCHARSICSLKPRGNCMSSSNRTNVSLVDIAVWIDPYYLTARFPNEHPLHLAPVDVYSQEDAMRAADYAEMVIEFINDIICKK